MYDIKCWGNTITALLNFLSSLSWPIIVLVIVCIFRQPIANLIARIKKIEVAGCKLEIGDMVTAYSPADKAYYSIPLQPPSIPTMKAAKVKISRLSDDEIEQSRQMALKRLEEDTKQVGYQRGKLYQLDNGKWAIAWDLEISAKIGLKDSTNI